MKKGPLSKKEKQYIEKYYSKLTPHHMAKHLERNIEVVEKHISTISVPITVVAEPVPVDDGEPKMPEIMDIMSKRKDFGVVIMTEAASMASDESKRRRAGQNPPSGRYKNCIHKIRED